MQELEVSQILTHRDYGEVNELYTTLTSVSFFFNFYFRVPWGISVFPKFYCITIKTAIFMRSERTELMGNSRFFFSAIKISQYFLKALTFKSSFMNQLFSHY